LYGCETWSLTLREEHRLRVFENRVLRRIFVPKRDEVTGEWRKLHSEELHNLYSSPDIIRQVKSRRMRWAGHVARMGEERKVYKILVGKPKGKRPLGRPRHRWEDGVRMDLREIGLGGCGLDSTGLGQGQVAGCCECGDEPSGSCTTELVSYSNYYGLCEISSYHGGEYEAQNLLGCTAVFLFESRPTSQRYALPPSSGKLTDFQLRTR
jgi:hypothetical protein